MPIRNRHRVGDHLMMDDESGLVHYRSEMVERWDGLWVRGDQNEVRNPQEFVRARSDPRAIRGVRQEPAVGEVCLFTPPTVGQTNVLTPKTVGTNFATLGEMAVGGSCGPFFVYDVSQI